MSFLNDIFGSKPKVPGLESLESAQKSAVKANVASFADIAKLATSVNEFNQDQLQQLMEKQLPGGTAKIQDLIMSRLSGEIPDDVSRAIQRSGAERGIAGGFAGSQFGRNLTARDLGLTSLGIIDSGFNSAMAWMQATRAPTFDASSMFITPAQKYEDQVNQFNRKWLEAKTNAAPDPVARGLHDTAMQLATSYLSKGGSSYQSYQPNYGGGTGFGSMGGFGGSYGPSGGGGGGGFGLNLGSWGFGKTGGSGMGGWFLGSKPGPG